MDPSVSRLVLVQTAARDLQPTMDVPGTERERHERRGREPEGGGTEEKKRGKGDGVLVASLPMAFGCPGELRLVAGSDGNGGEARARGCCLGSILIKRGQGCTGWLAGSGCARGLGRWDLEGSQSGRWRRRDRTGSLGFRVGLV